MNPQQVTDLINQRESNANRLATQITEKIKESMPKVIEEALSRKTFGNLGGDLIFPIEPFYTLTPDQQPFTRTAVTSYLEGESWHVNKLEIVNGSLDNGPMNYLQIRVGLRARR